jgi:hypothetical protein
MSNATDEGWWALPWIWAWDVTQEQRYLDMAESIFADMKNGTTSVSGGGTWWNKTAPEREYKNAIVNELCLSVAAVWQTGFQAARPMISTSPKDNGTGSITPA